MHFVVRIVGVILFALLIPMKSFAQEQDEKIKLTPIGRALVDAAAYMTGDDRFAAGAAIPEARLGLRGAYRDFKAKVEVGVSYGKLTLKDIYIEADFGENWLVRAGNFIHQYGLQSAYNVSMKSTMEMPVSNSVFDLPRSIGVMGTYCSPYWLLSATVGVESRASLLSSTEMGKTGWGIDGRFVWRPRHDDGYIVQIGWSGAYLTPQYNADAELNHESVTLNGNFPTSVARVSAVGADVTDARVYFKFTPELLIAKGRLALESQYYYGHVFRRNKNDYTAYGAYAILRGIIKGDGYRYYSPDARLDTPSPKSFELSLCYNYTCLTDRSAGISGGRVSDISCTLNWYINRYVIWRLRGGYSHSWDRADTDPVNLGSIQTRLQIIF